MRAEGQQAKGATIKIGWSWRAVVTIESSHAQRNTAVDSRLRFRAGKALFTRGQLDSPHSSDDG